MNIAVSIAITGGIGGIERNIYTFSKVMAAHSIDIYTMQFIPRGFVPRGKNVKIRWFEQRDDGLHITIEDRKDYALYIYYAACQPVYIGDRLNVRKKIVIPNGNDVRSIEKHFDYVFCQADDGIRYFDDMSKRAFISPCVIIPVDVTEPIADIPSKYFLTVFNPYDRNAQYEDGLKPTKGYDLIPQLADSMVLPLIWCHSDESLPVTQNIKEHPNIIHMPNISQETLYYLYKHATAYVSFSREESFGWSLADAIMFDKPIITRKIGVISSMDLNQRGLYLYQDSKELHNLLQKSVFENGNYDKTRFSPAIFEQKILALVDSSLT